jgi:hypothetical protein
MKGGIRGLGFQTSGWDFWDVTADIFTKPLDEKTFTKLRNELNIVDSRNFD